MLDKVCAWVCVCMIECKHDVVTFLYLCSPPHCSLCPKTHVVLVTLPFDSTVVIYVCQQIRIAVIVVIAVVTVVPLIELSHSDRVCKTLC